MKVLFCILGFVALYSLAVSGLPQLVGIIDQEILDAVDYANTKNSYYGADLELENFETKADPMLSCNYTSFMQAFTQWTVDAKFDQSANYTNNGQALKDAVNAIFKGLDPGDQDGAGKAWDQFCVTQRNFFNAQGVFQISNCVVASTLVQNGYNRVDSYQTQQVLNQVNFQCGAAFSTYVSTISTYVNASDLYSSNLNTCADDFITNLFTNESLVDHGCSALRTYEQCNGKVYYTATSNPDLAWTVCEATRRTNVITLPACRDSANFCQVSQVTS